MTVTRIMVTFDAERKNKPKEKGGNEVTFILGDIFPPTFRQITLSTSYSHCILPKIIHSESWTNDVFLDYERAYL